MLKIMFVDDEIAVLNGLKKSYNWKQLGFEVVGTAMDGNEAMERFYETFPDVIITDICMQNKDGLSFISDLKACNPEVEVIVLSGYPDFHYAQASMEYGAFAYLLKPLKNADFFATLEKVKNKIYQSRSSAPDQFLFKLLQMTAPSLETVRSLCRQYDIELPSCSYFVASIQIDDLNNQNNYMIYERLIKHFLQHLSRYYHSFVCQPQHHHISLLLFCEDRHMQSVYLTLIGQTLNKFKQQYGVSFTTGISRCFTGIPAVRDAYLQSLFAVSQKAIYGYGSTIHYHDTSDTLDSSALTTSLYITSEEIKDILCGIQTFNRVLTDQAVNSYFSRLNTLRNADINIIRNAMLELAVQIIHSGAPDLTTIKLIFGEIPVPMVDINKLDLLLDMEQYIKNLLDKIFSYSSFRVSSQYSQLVQDTQLFIMQNYSLPISIDSIADALHVDRFHLMRTFKNETGDTIISFLTRYRINIACDLLLNGNYRIAEVSSCAGFQDANYFSKLFKKYTNCLPSEYIAQKGLR